MHPSEGLVCSACPVRGTMAKTLIISSMKWSGLPPHNVKRNKTSNVESHLVLLALNIWAIEFIRSSSFKSTNVRTQGDTRRENDNTSHGPCHSRSSLLVLRWRPVS